MRQEVHVNIPAHLKRYLRDEFGNEELRVCIDKQKPLGQFIYSLLEEKPVVPYIRRFNLVFLLPDDEHEEGGNYLVMTEDGHKRFINFIEHIMIRDLFARLDLCREEKLEMKATMLRWIAKYELTDTHWNYDTLSKLYYRERTRQGEIKEHRIKRLV